ncbi:hypothetical protein BSLG_004278 [Batrachochytrium salamandrivorans]|nr:hypothetical protein BSLG_004278 [Batrachochytrium salamandrivorans]
MHSFYSTKASAVAVLLFAALPSLTMAATPKAADYPAGWKAASANPEWTKAIGIQKVAQTDLYDWTGDVLACPEKNQWGLTYDDGPTEHTNVVLDLLKANNVKATFFVVGSQVLQNPEILLRAYNEGHQIALHTWSHASLPKADMGVAIAEVVYNAMVVKQVIGVTPSFIRPPYGEISRSVREMLKKLGLTITMWNVDSRDGEGHGGHALSVFQEAMKTSRSTGILSLQHDIHAEQTKYAAVTLEAIIKQGSFKPMPVAQCLGTPAYDESFWTKLGVPVPGISGAKGTPLAPGTTVPTGPAPPSTTSPATTTGAGSGDAGQKKPTTNGMSNDAVFPRASSIVGLLSAVAIGFLTI